MILVRTGSNTVGARLKPPRRSYPCRVKKKGRLVCRREACWECHRCDYHGHARGCTIWQLAHMVNSCGMTEQQALAELRRQALA